MVWILVSKSNAISQSYFKIISNSAYEWNNKGDVYHHSPISRICDQMHMLLPIIY